MKKKEKKTLFQKPTTKTMLKHIKKEFALCLNTAFSTISLNVCLCHRQIKTIICKSYNQTSLGFYILSSNTPFNHVKQSIFSLSLS